MQLYRINALVIRYLKYSLRSIARLTELFYWPFFDIFIWGFTSKWIQANQQQAGSISLLLLSALVLWTAAHRVTIEISLSLLEDIWSRNMSNLFSTPLRLSEWIIAAMAVGFIKMLLVLSFAMFVVWLLYGITIFSLGLAFIPLLFLLILSGWSIGLVGAACIVQVGQRVQILAWIIGWFFAPFCGVFYPVSILPPWAQVISHVLPMTPVFEALRAFVETGTLESHYLFKSLLLNCVYLALALLFFKFMFERSRTKGLSRLETD